MKKVQGLAHRTITQKEPQSPKKGSPFIKSREIKTAVIIIKIMIKIYSIKITSSKALERYKEGDLTMLEKVKMMMIITDII